MALFLLKCVVNLNRYFYRLYTFIVARCGDSNPRPIVSNNQKNPGTVSVKTEEADGGKCNAKPNHRNGKRTKEQVHTFLGIAKGSRSKLLEPESLCYALQIGVCGGVYGTVKLQCERRGR